MRRFLSACILALAGCLTLAAADIRDVDIRVLFSKDGSAAVTEKWDVTVDKGTEWYLAKYNLGKITLDSLSVTDETGLQYAYEGRTWDVDRSLAEKAGRCGLVRKSGGYEVCWGLGSYGRHQYTVSYILGGAVQGMDDYDCFHMQMVSPGLSSNPKHVKVTFACADSTSLSEADCRIWGFGFNGTCNFTSDGGVVYESASAFSGSSSVICLMRFDKGVFTPSVTRGGSFQSVLDKAVKNSSYESREDEDAADDQALYMFGAFCALMIAMVAVCASFSKRRSNKKYLGVANKRDIEWCRDVPYDGDVLAADYVLSKVESSHNPGLIAGAMILRMMENGALKFTKDENGKQEISFVSADRVASLPISYRALYDMMKQASGTDQILQDKEFSRWSSKNTRAVESWCQTVARDGGHSLIGKTLMSTGGKFNEAGRNSARQLLGLRKFLKDFTLVNERASSEVGLWNDYLVFGTVFGIADKVAEELKDINPQVFSQTIYTDPDTAATIIRMTRRMGYAITNASATEKAKAAQKASAGMGGHTSIGGGGGFSGGGFGGGAR